MFKFLLFVLKALHVPAYGFTLSACGATICLNPFSHLTGGSCLCQDHTGGDAFAIVEFILSLSMFGQLSPSFLIKHAKGLPFLPGFQLYCLF